MLSSSVFFLLLSLLAVVSAELLVTFSVPQESSNKVGIYWSPNEPRGEEVQPYMGNSDNAEMLIHVLEPGAEQTESALEGSSFVVRSADFTSRTRVSFYMNKDEEDAKERPYSISFVNLAGDDRAGSHPLELQHSNAGYVWIDPNEHVEHVTAENHVFTLRDKEKVVVFSVVINGLAGAEL